MWLFIVLVANIDIRSTSRIFIYLLIYRIFFVFIDILSIERHLILHVCKMTLSDLNINISKLLLMVPNGLYAIEIEFFAFNIQ